jgi:hypothetical protein
VLGLATTQFPASPTAVDGVRAPSVLANRVARSTSIAQKKRPISPTASGVRRIETIGRDYATAAPTSRSPRLFDLCSERQLLAGACGEAAGAMAAGVVTGTITRRHTATCRGTCRVWVVITVTGTWTGTHTGT